MFIQQQIYWRMTLLGGATRVAAEGRFAEFMHQPDQNERRLPAVPQEENCEGSMGD